MAELTPEEKEVLKMLSQKGAMTPTEISVQQLKLPDEVSKRIKLLAQGGYVVLKQLRYGPEGEAVLLSDKGRKALRE